MSLPVHGPRSTRFLVPLLLAAFVGVALARRSAGPACAPCGFPGVQLCPAPVVAPSSDTAHPRAGAAVEVHPATPRSPL